MVRLSILLVALLASMVLIPFGTGSSAGPIQLVSQTTPSPQSCREQGRLGPEMLRFTTVTAPIVVTRGGTAQYSIKNDDGSLTMNLEPGDCLLHTFKIVGNIIISYRKGSNPTSKQCATAQPPIPVGRSLRIFCAG